LSETDGYQSLICKITVIPFHFRWGDNFTTRFFEVFLVQNLSGNRRDKAYLVEIRNNTCGLIIMPVAESKVF